MVGNSETICQSVKHRLYTQSLGQNVLTPGLQQLSLESDQQAGLFQLLPVRPIPFCFFQNRDVSSFQRAQMYSLRQAHALEQVDVAPVGVNRFKIRFDL